MVGPLSVGVAVDDTAGAAFGCVEAGADAMPDEAGFEAVPGTAEPLAAALLGVRALPAAEIVGAGPGFAGCAEVQPETTASAAAAVQRIRRADRCRGRCDRMLPRIIVFAWPTARSTLPS